MANYNDLKTAIQQVIKPNGNEEITGALLQQSLLSMISSLGTGYQFMGIATQATNPGTPDQNVYYLAFDAGTYNNFGGTILADGEIGVFSYNGTWNYTKTTANVQWINTIGLFSKIPDNSFGNDGDIALVILSDINQRVYKKMAGAWSLSTINANTLYFCNGIIYYKESIEFTGKFIPINDKTINRLNVFDDFSDLETRNMTFSKENTPIGKGYLNVVYKATIAAGIAASITKRKLSLNGCCVAFLYKMGNAANVEKITVRFNGLSIYSPSITKSSIGNGWYLFVAKTNFSVQTVTITVDFRNVSANDELYISDLKICDGAFSLLPSLVPKDTSLTTPSEVAEMIQTMVPSYDVKKVYDVTDSFYSSTYDTTLNILGKNEKFKLTDSILHNVEYNGSVDQIGFVAGIPNHIRIFGYNQSEITITFMVYDSEIGANIYNRSETKKSGWGNVSFDFELTSAQMSHRLRLRLNCNGATIYRVVSFSGVDNPFFLFTKSLTEINDEISASGSDWYNKKMATYGDSVTAICNGDFTKPFGSTGTNWANKVAQYFGMENQFGRGIGSQCFGWRNGGGSIAWCQADGNYVGRLDGTSYDDYLNPATQQSVLDTITALGYNPSVHTLIRGSLSSWLRITTQFPESIKSNINVILVMAHNDATQGSDQYKDAELSFVENSVVDTEWAASSYYSTYGGDYNLDSSLKGAIASTIMKLQAWMPQAIIVLMTPISGKGETGQLNKQLTVPAMQNVAEKVRFVHELMSIPLIDMYGYDGINGLNRTTYITDTIHPYSVAGANMLGRVVVGGLKNILPINVFDS